MALPSVNFLSPQIIGEINSTLKFQIQPHYKERYKDFLPLITEKVELKCKKIFEEIKRSAEKGCFSMVFREPLGDFSIAISHSFKEILGVEAQMFYDNVNNPGPMNNSIDAEILQPAKELTMRFFWTPELLKSLNHKHYEYAPTFTGETLYGFAKNAKETDFAFISSTGDKIPAHKLILKLKSPYFKTLFDGKFKDSTGDSLKWDYSTDCLNNFVQFIYNGKMNQSGLNAIVLLELLSISHRIEMNDLVKYCTDLVNECFENQKFHFFLIPDIINMGYLYNLKDLVVKGLELADFYEGLVNKKEDSSGRKYDWSSVLKEHYADLLAIAAQKSLVNVVKKLVEAINLSINTKQSNTQSNDC